MMKKLILLMITFVFTLACFGACFSGDKSEIDNSTGGNGVSSESEEVTPTPQESLDGGTTGKESEDEESVCLITFDSDGGSLVSAVSVKKGEKIPKPDDPAKSNKDGEYELLGWFYKNEEWNFEEDTVSEDITLTARWKLVSGYTNPFLPKN